MDPDGPGSRAERTFWTFWNYITDIVGRFLRPDPPGTEINDTNTTNSVNDELLDKDSSSPIEEGEELFVPESSVSTTQPVVFLDRGSELPSEMRQNVVEEDDKISEKDDGIREEEIETGIDVVSNLPIILTTMYNTDQSSDVTMNAEELRPKILVNSLEEMMNKDVEVSKQNSWVEADEPQNKDQLNENVKKEKNTHLALEAEITGESDTKTVEQEHCEGRDGKLQNDNMALEESAPILEKPEHAEADDAEEPFVLSSFSDLIFIESENDDNTNAMKIAEEIEIKNMASEDQYNETEMCLTATNLDVTRQNTCTFVTDSSDEKLNGMYKEDMNKLHTLVLVTDEISRQNNYSESYERKKDDAVVTQEYPDVEENPGLNCLDVESSVSDNEDENRLVKHKLIVTNTTDESANVTSENDKKEYEFKKDQSAFPENYIDMTNQNAMLDIVGGDSSKETCPSTIIDQDMTQQKTHTLEVADGESSTEEWKDTNKDDLNKLRASLVLETRNKTFQNEHCKVQGTDDSIIIQEVKPCTSKQEEHTGAERNEEAGYGDTENEKHGKLEPDIFGNDFRTKDLTHNIEDEEQLDFGLQTHISRFDFDHVEVSNETDSYMGKFCDTIKNKGGSTQEQASVFKNIPLGECEGKECPYSYKESREVVPDHNNESNDGSATQRFLEVGNCRENQTTLLQEEVESGAAKCLQNSGTNEGEGHFKDLMETELIKNSLEEHFTRPDMKTTSEHTKSETDFVSEEDSEEKGEDLKEEAGEIECEMRKSLCDVDTVVDGVEIQESQTEFLNFIFLDQSTFKNESNVQTVESAFVQMQTTGTDHVLDTEDSAFTYEEDIMKVKLQSTDEDSTTVSNDDVVHHEISANALSVEDVHWRCMLEPLICNDVIEDEILDLWIEQTSKESSEVREEDQGHDSQCDLPEEEKVESIPELSIPCDVNEFVCTTESRFFEQSLDKGASLECNKQELSKEQPVVNASCTLNKSEDLSKCSKAEPELETPWSGDLLKSLDTTPESTEDDEATTSQNTDILVSMSSSAMQNSSTFSVQTDDEPFTKVGTLSEPVVLTKDQSDSIIEIKNTVHMTVSPIGGRQLPSQKKSNVEALQEFERVEDIDKIDISKLDFTPQKSRIAVKNPNVRPPKDFRSLLHKPSLEPSPSKHLESHVPAGVPMGGLGIRVKLPGLGAGFPVLKKTKKTAEEESETTPWERKPVEEEDDKVKQEDSQQRPKWMPPSHPGFGNPFMSELKSKLKKTTKE